jgi:hypothetical protein
MQKNPLFTAALKYLKENNFSVIPVRPDKKPFIKWQEYQKRLPTEKEITDWWTKYPNAGIGLITGQISNLAIIDLDEVENAKDVLNKLIPDSLVFPIVQTPSGGEHWFFSCTDPDLGNNTRIVPGCDLRANGGYVVAPPSINGNGKKWRWLDETITPTKVPLPYLPLPYLAYLKEHASPYINKHFLKSEKEEKDTVQGLNFSLGTRDDDLFHVANCLIKGKMPEKNTIQVLEIIAKNCNPPYPIEDVKIKVKSALNRQEGSLLSVTKEIESLLSVTDGAFSVTEFDAALQSVTGVTRRYNGAIRQVFFRWKNEGRIKKWGDRAGWYIKVEDRADTIQWWDADTSNISIKYPFKIEDYALTFPKNIITLAGEANSGKTAFCLNFARLNIENIHKMPITYCSSEMGPAELKMRLSKFENIQLPEWRRVKFIERASNFVDIIDPDGINVVDYMEITDNFYKVAEYTKEIFDKLNKGICLIAIQKDKKADYGRGGGFSLEKPRIYLNMGHGQIKIVKAKSWVTTNSNPNNMVLDFNIINGSEMRISKNWRKIEKDRTEPIDYRNYTEISPFAD